MVETGTVTLPVDLLPVVAGLLRDQAQYYTLSKLLRLSHETYPIISCILHSRLHFHSDDELFKFLGICCPDTFDTPLSGEHRETLNRVKHLHLDIPPSPRSSTLILRLAELMPTYHVFPSCTKLSIHGNALKALPTRSPSASYNTSKSCLKVYDSIRRLCLPKSLEIVRKHAGCPAYREMHTYFLTPKSDQRIFISSLKDHWPDLTSVNWGETHTDEAYAVHGVENSYHVPRCDCAIAGAYARDLFGSMLNMRSVTPGKLFRLDLTVVLRGPAEIILKVEKGMIEEKNRYSSEGMLDKEGYNLRLEDTSSRPG